VQVFTTLSDWRRYCEQQRAAGKTIGLVPTMGALHAGHASLMQRARRECDVVVTTIFVNPRQFNQASDLSSYPRTPEADLVLCEANGVDVVIEPALGDMWPSYPAPTLTTVSVSELSRSFEGAGRPGHFDGVASVVAKLFIVTGPCTAYFGEKDFQQIAVVRQMASDLSLDVTVVACPTVRDSDGLALSSRNVRLTEEGRSRATALSRALDVAQEPAPASTLRYRMNKVLAEANLDVEYCDIVEPHSLAVTSDDEAGERRALLCCIVDGVRLIDNAAVVVTKGN